MAPLKHLLPLILLTACVEPREVSDVASAFDPTTADGFWTLPFPSDLRLTAEGRPDYTTFPNPSDSPLVNQYLEFGAAEMDGWGLNSPIWFDFDAPVALPVNDDDAALASLNCEGPVRILDVDPDSPAYGTCLPARWEQIDSFSSDPYVDPDLVAVAPYWGFPLRSGTTYAVFLVDLQDDAGSYVGGHPDLALALAGEHPDTAVQSVYQSLADLLAARPELGSTEGELTWIAAATVFTTQDVLSEMELLADFVRSSPELPAWTGELELLPEEHEEFEQAYPIYDGSYIAQNFQRGEVPYTDEGGGFVWDGDTPVPQSEEEIRFAISLPRPTFEQPAAGWPVVIQSHGTGGDRFSHFGDGLNPANMFANRGFVSMGIAQPFHGARWEEGNPTAVNLYSFNYFNPESGTTTFRQAALDTVSQVEFLLRELTEGGAMAEAHPELRIDPDNIYYFGHSQGGLTGGLAIPFTHEVKTWILSGTGGGISRTIMLREDPFVIRDLLLTGVGAPDGTELFEMHPLVGMVQALAEKTDPLNYGPRWIAESNRQPVSILMTEGLHDAQTPSLTAEALATAARLPIARPFDERDVPGLRLRGFDEERAPYRGNLDHPSGDRVTGGLAQFDDDHFVVFRDSSAALLYANMLWSQIRDDEPPEVGADFP